MKPKDFYNGIGFPDPTAYTALKRIERDEARLRLRRLIKLLKKIIEKSGFVLLNNIEVKDIESGIIFTGRSRDGEARR